MQGLYTSVPIDAMMTVINSSPFKAHSINALAYNSSLVHSISRRFELAIDPFYYRNLILNLYFKMAASIAKNVLANVLTSYN